MGGGHMGRAQQGGTNSHPGSTHTHQGGAHAHQGGTHFGSQPGIGHFHGAATVPQHHGGHHHNGHFVHGSHGGVARVWWVSGGVWYPYAYPYTYTYAYPAPVYATTVSYYCASAGAYYPYVDVCPEGWVLVTQYVPAY
jgi:hypothetical protein